MQMAGIIIKVENLTDIKTPLSAYAIKNNFKVYMKDIGLLISLLGQEAHEEIFENKIEIFKGAIFENIFADLLDKKNKEIYFLNQNKGFELDFVFKDKDCLDIFEIKSSNNRTKSLRTFYEQNCTKIKNFKCYKFISGKSGYTPEFVTFPHWVILFF
jgi:predicted AAA+ superfamily ATPase